MATSLQTGKMSKVIPATARQLLIASAFPLTNNTNNTAARTLFFYQLYSTKATLNHSNYRLNACPLSLHASTLTPSYSAFSIMSQMDGLRSGCGISGVSSVAGAPSQNGGDAEVFPLSSSSVLKVSKGDITKWSVDGSSDAIVNPANERMLGGGGADGAIHRAAGPELLEACYKVPEVSQGVRCPTGEARITPGFNLPSAYVIHTVGPIYNVNRNPEALLRNAYRNSLTVAKDNKIKYIAFPAISCGVYGYPFEEASDVAISVVKEFANDFKEVHFVLFSDDMYGVWSKKAKEMLHG